VRAFASPRSAIDAAVAAQLALELPVRMGIATGEAQLRDGDTSVCAQPRCAGDGGRPWRSPAITLNGITSGEGTTHARARPAVRTDLRRQDRRGGRRHLPGCAQHGAYRRHAGAGTVEERVTAQN